MPLSLSKIKQQLSHFLGHSHCYLCHQTSKQLICSYCMQDTVLPLFPSPGHNLLENKNVVDKLLSPHYESLHALGKYQNVVSILINQLKFANKPIAAKVLCELFTHYLGQRLITFNSVPQALVPIPLSQIRYLNRQYNQSRLMTQHLASYFECEHVDLLRRIKHTKQQSRLNKAQREENMKNAFMVTKKITHQSIVLVDDVITTGATINEACKVLRQQSPDLNIGVWTMAVRTKDE